MGLLLDGVGRNREGEGSHRPRESGCARHTRLAVYHAPSRSVKMTSAPFQPTIRGAFGALPKRTLHLCCRHSSPWLIKSKPRIESRSPGRLVAWRHFRSHDERTPALRALDMPRRGGYIADLAARRARSPPHGSLCL